MEETRRAALEVLRHCIHGPFNGLPRTAGWGYPEPYTRDWMIASLGILVSGDEELVDGLRRMLVTLGQGQTPLGSIPSLASDPLDCGASDTTPLFLIALALFRKVTGETDLLEEEARKALTWLRYQSPDDGSLVAQQPTSDWRDEQWVLGYGLFVNTLVYASLRLHGLDRQADRLKALFNHAGPRQEPGGGRSHEGLALPDKPYYALWAYKVHSSDRFDLPGNSLAMLFGLANADRANRIADWVEAGLAQMQARGELACDLPPCLFPFILETDPDWMPRYALFNRPGDYHNGGIWPFTVGLYIAALTAAGRHDLAARKLEALTELVRPAREHDVSFGFNEWLHPRDCTPRGQDWQVWSAAMFIYAAACVEQRQTPFFHEMQKGGL